jgi:type 1 glutamine amidotransferase
MPTRSGTIPRCIGRQMSAPSHRAEDGGYKGSQQARERLPTVYNDACQNSGANREASSMLYQRSRTSGRLSVVLLFVAALVPVTVYAQTAGQAATKMLILVGPSTHPPGTHEVAAGARLLEYCLTHAENVRGIEASVISKWPDDRASLKKISTVVFTGDRFPPEEMPDRDRIMADLSSMMDHGCGLVCIHYATGLAANQVPPDGDHPLLRWMGGYFATKCTHHQSIARIYKAATIEPGSTDHPVLRGWKTFTVNDEPYIKNYFGPAGLAPNVTVLATSQLPPESPQREIVGWAVSRSDGGRGAGIVMPHFYRNWAVDDLRKFILNAVVWSAKLDVPAGGVKTTLPDLSRFEPAAVEPKPAK